MKKPIIKEYKEEYGDNWLGDYSIAQDKYIDYLEQINLTIPVVSVGVPCKHDYVKTGLSGELYCYKCDTYR